MPFKRPPFRVTLVAVPLGNPTDLSERAKDTLRQADLIFCEDTRKFHYLAQQAAFQIKARLINIPGDQEKQIDWSQYFAEPSAQWALVSDAGTPVVNDPGRSLSIFCQENNIELRAVPGPSAPMLLWQWCGGFGLPFHFAGFAPKANSNAKCLQEFFEPLAYCGTFVFFDTKHQVLKTFEYLLSALDNSRGCFIGRDMTKPHEELIGSNLLSCLQQLRRRVESEKVGELTILLQGETKTRISRTNLDAKVLLKIRQAPPRQAAKIISTLSGRPVSECYNLLAEGSRE